VSKRVLLATIRSDLVAAVVVGHDAAGGGGGLSAGRGNVLRCLVARIVATPDEDEGSEDYRDPCLMHHLPTSEIAA
jgi:hypothetical protein